jgi:hypothetical protein
LGVVLQRIQCVGNLGKRCQNGLAIVGRRRLEAGTELREKDP